MTSFVQPYWVMGLGGSGHDFSVALGLESDIRVAVESERLTRRKHGKVWAFENPFRHAVMYCLNAEHIDISDISCIVGNDMLPTRSRQEFPFEKLFLYRHHLCHAATAALFVQPNQKAAIIVYDGMGSIRSIDDIHTTRETFSFYLLEDGKLSCLGETMGRALREDSADFTMHCSNSMGHFYKIVTHILGFNSMEEGKTMGLAAHGTPRFYQTLREYISLEDDMNNCFKCDPISDNMADNLEKILRREGEGFTVKADLAASVQAVMDEVLLHCWKLLAHVNPDVTCISGGCALNSASNGNLAKNLPLGLPLLIPPCAGDEGTCFGALWLHQQEVGKKKSMTFREESPYPSISRPGRLYSKEECRRAVNARYPELALDCTVIDAEGLAKILASGKIVGVFNGRSESGPRALGGRSILADPRQAQIRERLNRDIKGREPFRPLAPMVLDEAFAQYFLDERQKDSFMIKISSVTDRCRRDAPAAVHVNGTARVQCVSTNDDPFLRELLRAFAQLTGVPILLNTSFNRRGEPIVETPADAVDCFLGLGLDGLFLNGEYYFRCIA